MHKDRSPLPFKLVWLALVFLTLRPIAPVQRVVDVATAPLRVLAELASPLAFLQRQRVRAAEHALASAAEENAEENVRLLADLARSALPAERRLIAGRRAVHAEVLGHRDWDHLEIRLRDPRGVAPGMPVARGDAYVGKVTSVDGDRAEVALVAGRDAFVGAIVEQPEGATEPVLMTVGGVVTGVRRRGSRRADVLGLAVHYPSDRALEGGLARVHELFHDEEPYAELCEGLRLGRVVRHGDGHVVEPELDYKDGLFQVVVLTPLDPSTPSALPFDTVLYDSAWVRAQPLSVGDPSPARDTRKLRVGARHGVSAGAAVTSIGGHLVGRVLRAGHATSDVALLGDVGFSVVAVARFDGFDEPQILGRLIALGRDPGSGDARFRWLVRAPLARSLAAEGGKRIARLYTGSGDPGLPAGFSIGTAELAVDVEPGERTITLHPDVEEGQVHDLFVRTRQEVRE